jgi:hypothetical protein
MTGSLVPLICHPGNITFLKYSYSKKHVIGLDKSDRNIFEVHLQAGFFF